MIVLLPFTVIIIHGSILFYPLLCFRPFLIFLLSFFQRCESPSSSLVLFQASQHVPTPRNQKSHKQQHKKPLLPITNGLGQDPLLPPFTPPSLTNNNLSSSVSCSLLTTSQSFYSTPIIPETLTVEIDPNSRGSRTTLGLERSSCVCLPSPVSSILGPMRTLQILTESSELEDQRPVRQVSEKCRT